MWGKEMGKWLAEDTTALWCDHSTSYSCFMEGYSIFIGTVSTLYSVFSFFIILSEGKNNNNF